MRAHHSSYPNPISATEAIDLLARATSQPHHEFWTCDVSLLDSETADPSRIHGPRQVTDAYLLALATARHSRFATFDRSISLAAVPAATAQNLTVV